MENTSPNQINNEINNEGEDYIDQTSLVSVFFIINHYILD